MVGTHKLSILLLLAVGGTTTFTLPLQRLGASVGLVVGQLGFMLGPALLMPLALSRPAGLKVDGSASNRAPQKTRRSGACLLSWLRTVTAFCEFLWRGFNQGWEWDQGAA